MHILKKSKIIAFFGFLLGCFYLLKAQDQVTSSHVDTLSFYHSLKAKPFDELVDTYYNISYKDSIKTNVLVNYLEANFLASSEAIELGETYLAIADWKKKKGRENEYIPILNKVIKIAATAKVNYLLFSAYAKKARFYYYQGKHKQALDAGLEAIQIAKIQNNKIGRLNMQLLVGLIRNQYNDFKGAIAIFHENIALLEGENLSKNEAQILINTYIGLCRIYAESGAHENARKYCDKVWELSNQSGNEEAKIYYFSAYSDIERQSENFEKAHEHIDKAEEIFKKSNSPEGLYLYLKLDRAKNYFFEEKYRKTIGVLEEIEQLKEEYGIDYIGLDEVYYYFIQSYKQLNDLDKAIEYNNIAIDIYYNNDKEIDQLQSDIIRKFDLPKLKNELEELKDVADVSRQRYYIGLGILASIILALVFANYKQRRKNKQKFNALMQQLDIQEKLKSKKNMTISPKKIIKNIDHKAAEILKKLIKYEEENKYLSKDTTLAEVAKKIQTNTTYLSKVINIYKEKSFTTYITDLRVNYAIERLSHDRKFRSYTIGAIAQEIGFKRSESFSKAFKVKTGLYPSYFIKEIEKQQNNKIEN